MARVIRQGDALFIEQRLPNDAKWIDAEEIQIASESGNPHRLTGVQVFQKGEDHFVELREGRVLSHPQHRSVTVPVGTYRVATVRHMDFVDQLFRASSRARPTTPRD